MSPNPNPNPNHLPPEALDAWLAAAAAKLGLDAGDVRIGTVLDVARDVAHGVARPAAPLSTFLLGVAVGRAAAASADGAGGGAGGLERDPETVLAEQARRLVELAARWDPAA